MSSFLRNSALETVFRPSPRHIAKTATQLGLSGRQVSETSLEVAFGEPRWFDFVSWTFQIPSAIEPSAWHWWHSPSLQESHLQRSSIASTDNNVPGTHSETGRIRFRRVRFQTPNSVSFLGLTEFRGPNSVSSFRPILCVQTRTHRVSRRTHRVRRRTQ